MTDSIVRDRARRMLSKANRLREQAAIDRRRAESLVASASADEAEATALSDAAELLAREHDFYLTTTKRGPRQ